MVRLTEVAHEFVRSIVQQGDTALDATAGNGHDTLFLAQLVGTQGNVIACDVQQQAIDATQHRLQEHQIQHVELIRESHDVVLSQLTETHTACVTVVMMNLGYLPGGNKTLTTTADSTRAAIRAALILLKPGGALTVLAYVGHPGGQAEADTVRELLEAAAQAGIVSVVHWPDSDSPPTSPQFFAVIRTAERLDEQFFSLQ